MLRHELPDSQYQNLANQFGLTPLFRGRSAVRTLRLQNPMTRDSLMSLARRIRTNASAEVLQAGIVISPPDRYAPALVTNEFVAHFPQNMTRASIDSMNAMNGVEVVRERPGARRYRFVLRPKRRTLTDGLRLANLYAASGRVTLAQPNLVHVVISAYTPKDELFTDQWHHENTGATGGVADADLDTPKAWDLSKGSGDVVVAVIDAGFETAHPDLQGSLWENEEELDSTAREGHDDDGNGYKDDTHGWDFWDCDWVDLGICTDPECGQLDVCMPTYDDAHGTPVAALVAAPADNDCGATTCEGVVGVCPDCKVMLLRRSITSEGIAAAFTYAVENGADVITNSWVLTFPLDSDIEDAMEEAGCVAPRYSGGACRSGTCEGIPIFFATGDEEKDGCDPTTADMSMIQLPYVIAVGGTDDQDRRARETTYGSCMDVMAPTHGGARHVVTADERGEPGYNTEQGDPADGYIAECPSGTETADTDYTRCFSGTSASTPMAAGIAGLLLSAHPCLSRDQIQTVLQDTADKIESDVAGYDANTGFSNPTAVENTRGFGRANAYEAVRLVAPRPQGRQGVDIMLRDNTLDWGNTEQPSSTRFADDPSTAAPDRGTIGHWAGQDVKIVAGPCPATAPSAVDFDGLTDGDIAAGADNCLYVRVRNRGFTDAASGDVDGDGTDDVVSVKAYWAHIGTVVPDLPSDFWSGFSTNSFTGTDWNFIGQKTIESIPYSGATAARDARVSGSSVTDDAGVVILPFTGPPLDPLVRNHYCLLAMVDSPDDHVSAYATYLDTGANPAEDFKPDVLTPHDNNVSHRNYQLFDTSGETAFTSSFYIRNTSGRKMKTEVDVMLPPGWKYSLEPIRARKPVDLKAGSKRLITVHVDAPSKDARGEVTVVQRSVPPKPKKKGDATEPAKVLGGLTLIFAPKQ